MAEEIAGKIIKKARPDPANRRLAELYKRNQLARA